MPAAIMRRVALGLIGCLMMVATASAGPYFNADRPAVSDLSRVAVAQLNAARIAVIEMFTALDAGNGNEVALSRSRALSDLQGALGIFREIGEKVGTRPLSIKPRSDEEGHIIDEFMAALQKRKIEPPTTERDLAKLAVTIVDLYAQSLEKASLAGFPKQWQGVRQIILSEIDLLYVGNLASIVWVISAPAS
jgi:hypothetical protein